ncbi:MAG: hypothetical protein R3321_04575 [Nitrososphaeraceae archaeon]|nr:hypothetical protein [Nitrososphaeraceae archaeon]
MSSITFTTKTKEKNPNRDLSIQVNSIAIASGRLLASLIREGKVNIGVEAKVSMRLKTNYQGDVMENIISLKIEQIDEDPFN